MTVAIAFADAGEPARINYRVPLPGAHTGRRIVELDLDLGDDVFIDSTRETGDSLADRAGVSRTDRGILVDSLRAREFFVTRMQESGVHLDTAALPLLSDLQVSNGDLPASGSARGPAAPSRRRWSGSWFGLSRGERTGESWLRRDPSEVSSLRPVPDDPLGALRPEADPELLAVYLEWLRNLQEGVVTLPGSTWSGRPTTITPSAVDPLPVPQLFLVELYGISSFLGDYGMGRTVKTFTLLPGESTTISLKTWQSSKKSIEQSSSIIDSHEQAARDRFADKVQTETTDKRTKSKTEKWHAEAEVSASWGFGSAKVSGGGSGDYQSGREQFAKQASEAVKEHAAEASSKRQLSVTSSSERTEETGTESLIERTIANANMRRVLNFVFRELNQTYITKLHLKDIHVAFTNGRLNSWREVPLSGLGTLLEEMVRPERREKVARRILKVAGIIFDRDDTAVNVLEHATVSADGTGIKTELASLDQDGDFPAPTSRTYYRFRPGPLEQDGEDNPVDGVLLSTTEIVLRTDSVLVEALLGQADGLDAFAMEVQQATAAERTLANRRQELLLQILTAIDDPERQAELAGRVFGTCCPDEG